MAKIQKEELLKILDISCVNEDFDSLSSKDCEKQFMTYLIKLGYTHKQEKLFVKSELQGFSKDNRFLNDKFFVYQPFGTQNAPDFIIVIYGLVICVEVKTSCKNVIMWNSHIPRNDFLYYIKTKNINTITRHFIDMNDEKLLKLREYKERVKELAKEYNFDDFSIYPRFMINGTKIDNEMVRKMYKQRSLLIDHLTKLPDRSLDKAPG